MQGQSQTSGDNTVMDFESKHLQFFWSESVGPQNPTSKSSKMTVNKLQTPKWYGPR